ncbi:UNVERIFIED_CONTAM: hypothetical protein Slati_0076900 [Sesamum latifolium]|uniref:Uncharacterized protein n=1 Tax=Sesamum latifolium TaxID=2727402 RepID=A0AAW2Y7X2_9LAMI
MEVEGELISEPVRFAVKVRGSSGRRGRGSAGLLDMGRLVKRGAKSLSRWGILRVLSGKESVAIS